MRVPVLLISDPDGNFWLTDEHGVSQAGHPVLIDASGHIYRPADVSGPILIKEGMCSHVLYAAAYEVGYQVVWVNEEVDG